MADRIQFRRDTAARWAEYNPVLLEGEVGYITDKLNQHKIGDGKHAWNDLPLQVTSTTVVQDVGDSTEAVMSQAAVSKLTRITGYATCDTAASSAEKIIYRKYFTLDDNCRLLVCMENSNTAASVTLNINGTGAKPLYYKGNPASATNTWKAGEVLDIYYDGTNYQAYNIEAGAVPVILTMTTLAGNDELRGAEYNDLISALANGHTVLVIDKQQRVNYVVSASFDPFAMVICNPYGRCVRLDLTQSGSAVLYTETELPQAGDPLLLEVQGNNMPLAGTATMRDINKALGANPIYIDINNKTNRVIAFDPVKENNTTLYYYDVNNKGIVRVDLTGETDAVPTAKMTLLGSGSGGNEPLTVDVSNCWTIEAGNYSYDSVDLGVTVSQIAEAVEDNRLLMLLAPLAGDKIKLYPTSVTVSSNGISLTGAYNGSLYTYIFGEDKSDAQKCRVFFGYRTVPLAPQS